MFALSLPLVVTNVRASEEISFMTEWWETISLTSPQFTMTIFNGGNYGFTITKVVLGGITVWSGRFVVLANSVTNLTIPNISEVFDNMKSVNVLNEVWIEDSVYSPAYRHNIIMSRDYGTYGEHTRVRSTIGLKNSGDSRPSTEASTAIQSATTKEGSAYVDQLFQTGIKANITGCSAPDGSQINVASANYGTNQPSATGAMGTLLKLGEMAPPTFYNVKITSDVPMGSNAMAAISIHNPSFVRSQIIMLFWNGNEWIEVKSSFDGFGEISGSIPVSSLEGTIIAVVESDVRGLIILLFAIVLASVCVAVLAVVTIRRRRKKRIIRLRG